MEDSDKGYESDREFCELEVYYKNRDPGFFMLTRSYDDKTIGYVKDEILSHAWPDSPIDDPRNQLGLYVLEETEDGSGVETPVRLLNDIIVKDCLKRLCKSGKVAIYRIANQEQGAQH